MKITPDQLREHIEKVDVSFRHVYQKLGINAGWFNKMMQNKFENPDPKRMQLIMNYLKHFERMQKNYEKHTV